MYKKITKKQATLIFNSGYLIIIVTDIKTKVF